MIKLSKRLEALSSLIPINSHLIDIGCDHGLLDIYLYQKGISSHIIASDINQSALNNACENIKKYHLEDKIITKLSNGLENITKEDGLDTIVISGMGAHTIVGILKRYPKKLTNIKTIIIQSNTKLPFLRKEITNLNYYISDELIVEDNKKNYFIIKFEKGRKKYSSKELYFGPILLQKNSKLFQKYHHKNLEKLFIIQKLIPRNKIITRYKLKKEINLYKNVSL